MHRTLLAAALIAAPAAMMAEGFSYTYAEGRYFSSDSDALSINQQGGTLSGSLALGPVFFVALDGSFSETEEFTVLPGTAFAATGKIETTGAALRGGAHYALTPVLDIVGSAGVLFADVSGKGDFKDSSDDDTGYVVDAGLRMMVIPQVEVGAFFNYQSLFDSEASGFTLDAQYHITENWSAVVAASNAKSSDFYNAGVRYRF